MMHLVESESHKPYKASVNVNGKLLSMEIASVSVVGKETFDKNKRGVSSIKLQETPITLKTYTGQQIALLGSAPVPVEQTLNLPLVVTKEEGLPLLRQDRLAALHLDWRSMAGSSRKVWVNFAVPKRRSTWIKVNNYNSFHHI